MSKKRTNHHNKGERPVPQDSSLGQKWAPEHAKFAAHFGAMGGVQTEYGWHLP